VECDGLSVYSDESCSSSYAKKVSENVFQIGVSVLLIVGYMYRKYLMKK
jgi:hypothetical protein